MTNPRISTGRCHRGSNGQPCLAGAKPSVDPSKGVAAEGSARKRATASRQPNARPRDVASTTTGSAMAAALELLLTCISKGDRSQIDLQLRTAAVPLAQQEVTKRKACSTAHIDDASKLRHLSATDKTGRTCLMTNAVPFPTLRSVADHEVL